jgi:hypothetical protein
MRATGDTKRMDLIFILLKDLFFLAGAFLGGTQVRRPNLEVNAKDCPCLILL